MQRNLATDPETFFRHLQAGGGTRTADLSLMAASLTGLSGLAAGLGLPLPQYGFPVDAKPESRFLHNKRMVSQDDIEDDDQVSWIFNKLECIFWM